MPLYDYKCPDCGDIATEFIHSISKVEETVFMCDHCGSQRHRVMCSGVKYQYPTGAFFEPYMETDLGPKPVLIRSVDHMHEECRKRGLGIKKMPPKAAR